MSLNIIKKHIKNQFFFFSYVFLVFFIVLSLFTYTNFPYHQIDSYNKFKEEYNVISSYFIHSTNSFPKSFTEKEKLHYNEVRDIFDTLFIIFLLSLVGLFFLFKEKKRNTLFNDFSKKTLFFFMSLIILLSVVDFTSFFIYFHKLLFSNNYWLLNPNDISYYLFTDAFFFKITIEILSLIVFIHLIIFLYTKYKTPK